MEIHRPKTFHSFREFLKEYAIIVLGVLTALALESGLLALRDARQAGEARANIREEIATDLGLMDYRATREPCVSRRFDEIESLIDHPSPGGPVWIGHPSDFPMRDARFHAAEQAGRVALLPTDEQALYAQIYTAFAGYNDALDREQVAVADLRILERPPAMTPEVALRLKSALQQARTARWKTETSADWAHRVAKQLGVAARAPSDRFKIQSICIPLTTPRSEALKMMEREQSSRSLNLHDQP
jgi:hypothetical protein